MLIELDHSLVPLLSTAKNASDQVCTALDLISHSRREGNHLIFTEIDTASRLINEGCYLSAQTLATLSRTINQYPSKAGLAQKVTCRVLIGNFDVQSIDTSTPGKKIIKMPVKMVNMAFLQKTILLVENLQDAVFYKSLAMQEGGENPIPVEFEARLGGGNTTAEVFVNIAAQNRLCLCVVDSDIKYPGGPIGDTANRVLKAQRDHNNPLSSIYVLPVYSVENLIPIETIRHAFEADAGQLGRVDSLTPLYTDGTWPFLPLKKGIKCADIVNMETPAEKFWSPIIGETPILQQCREKQRDQRCERRDSCSHYIYQSLGPQTLKSVLSYLGLKNQFVGVIAIEPMKRGWTELKEQLLAWCCAGTPLRT